MGKQAVLDRIQELGLLAVIRGPNADDTVRVVDALVAGGVLGIEITFTTPDALDVMARLAKQYGDQIVLGAGTCTTPEHARSAADAGAVFLVSPHTEPELAAAMTGTGLPTMMGALTPSEVMQAVKLGSDIVKLFPGSLGGPSYMKALKGPYPGLKIMPTGGVALDNIAAWFAAGAVAVGAGSQLCPKDWIAAGRFDDITLRAEEYTRAIAEARTTR